MMMATRKSVQDAIALFQRHGGILRTAEALRLGIHPRTLYAMRDSGVLERLSLFIWLQSIRSSDERLTLV